MGLRKRPGVLAFPGQAVRNPVPSAHENRLSDRDLARLVAAWPPLSDDAPRRIQDIVDEAAVEKLRRSGRLLRDR